MSYRHLYKKCLIDIHIENVLSFCVYDKTFATYSLFTISYLQSSKFRHSHMESYLGESTVPSALRGLFSVALRKVYLVPETPGHQIPSKPKYWVIWKKKLGLIDIWPQKLVKKQKVQQLGQSTFTPQTLVSGRRRTISKVTSQKQQHLIEVR